MDDDEGLIEERRRKALDVARQQSEAMEAGYRHLMGHEEPVSDEDDEPPPNETG